MLEEYSNAARPNLKPRTITRYQHAIEKHLKPAFGKQKLHNGQSPASIRLVHSVLSSATKRMVRLKQVQTNVCSDVQLSRVDREEVRVFDATEVRALLTVTSQDSMEALWILALTTGARVSELKGLQVQDYEPVTGTLDIRRSVYNGAVGTTKSKKGKRQIKLPAIARDSLDRHARVLNSTFSPWMFPNSKGNTIGFAGIVGCPC